MIRSLVAAVLTLGMASSAFAIDKAYFDIKSVQVTEVTEQYPQAWSQPGLVEDCSAAAPTAVKNFEGEFNPLETLNVTELVIDQIINIGKKIFAVVEMGKPVVNIAIDTANALPKGLTCWSDLSSWSMPQSKVYSVTYKNGFGMNVVKFDYRVTYTAGGSVDGVGQYITNATFMPANVTVGWGFQFDAQAVIPSVFNTGTRTAPVAGMQMNMAWKVTSPIVHNQATDSYFVSGANTLTRLQ